MAIKKDISLAGVGQKTFIGDTTGTLKNNLHALLPMNEKMGDAIDEINGYTFAENIKNTVLSLTMTGGPETSWRDFSSTTTTYMTSRVPSSFPIGGANPWTVSIWLQFDVATAGGQYILGKWHSSNAAEQGWLIFWEGSGSGSLGLIIHNNTTTQQLSRTASAATKYFCCARYDGTTMSWSINNGTAATVGVVGVRIPTTPILHMATTDFTSQNLDGKIGQIGIWNRALTNAEVTSLYNSGSGLIYG